MKGRELANLTKVILNLCGLSREDIDDGRITLGTQPSLEEGRPDIRINIDDRYAVFVEVKDWSSLTEGQLEGYCEQIQTEYGKRGRLVLLTRSRHSIQETSLDPTLYHHVCWYEIYTWLDSLQFTDKLTAHLVSEFMTFLEGKAMGVQKVTWEYENGIKSMIILTQLLETAISEAWPDAKVKRTAGWSWRGLYVEEEYFVGCRFDDPTTLVFENNHGNNPTFKLDLDFYDAHFHSLSSGEQLETLTSFIKSARTEAERSSI
jgi:hypothetical protein